MEKIHPSKMDAQEIRNPFRLWITYDENQSKIVYLPNSKVVEIVLKRSGVNLFGFDTAKKYPHYNQLKKQFIERWTDGVSFVYNDKDETVIHDGQLYKVTYAEKYKNTFIRYINGWIGHPFLGTYLVRTLKGNGENEENPFNEFAGKSKFLPDITYLPKLYKELGVKSFDDLHISGTGDWRNLWRDLEVTLHEEYPIYMHFVGPNYYSSAGFFVLWQEGKTLYLNRIPEKVTERLKQAMAVNVGKAPIEKLSKDPFQLILAQGNIKGKELISLCDTDESFKSLCNADNQNLFKRHLLKEFGMSWRENQHGFDTPEELYRQMYTYYEGVVLVNKTYYFAGIYKDGKNPIEKLQNHELHVMIPRQTMREDGKRRLTIVLFPQEPTLSFYAAFSWYDNDIKLYETTSVRRKLSEKELNDFVMPLLHLFLESNGLEKLLKNAEQYLNQEVLRKLIPDVKIPRVTFLQSQLR